ncbi:Nuclear hormone receptor family member nhr-19 [Aphelenchoides avenae]|nr:Nuclear hormone receptor family member nhr-19 [Aphelenchus avenae]
MASTPSSSSSCSDDVAPLKQCLICGCESTGKHYGCQSCSSCKAFFRRAVLDDIDTRCKRTPTCLKNAPINHICRSCRFQRCLDKGMKKSGKHASRHFPLTLVAIGLHAARDSIGKRSPKAQATTDVVRVGSISPCEPLNSTFNMLQLLAELTYNDKTLRKRKAENLRPKGIQYAKTSSTKLADGDDVREVTETELVNLVEWANTLPLFEHLSHEDRQMLLKK